MSIKIERYDDPSWTDITDQIPLRGYSPLGLSSLSIQKVPNNSTALARFCIPGINCQYTLPGDEIRISGTLLVPMFGGYIGRRIVRREGSLYGATYELHDYNSVLDRCVISGYQIDDGDTDSTEITTLVNTYLSAFGITVGQIDTVQATLEELYLQCTFRQALEAIAGQAGGAHFFIDGLKQLHYVQTPQDISAQVGRVSTCRTTTPTVSSTGRLCTRMPRK